MHSQTKVFLDDCEGKAKYDAQAKRLFRHKELCAPILKMVVPEYKDCTIEEIIAMIEAIAYETIPVSDIKEKDLSDIDPMIQGENVEDKSPYEKLIFFDIKFKSLNPMLSHDFSHIYLFIDLEIQKTYTTGYPIIKRGLYYAARSISRQLELATNSTNYNKISKVYSIWICNDNVPEELENTLTRYRIQKEDVIGTVKEPISDYDLMEVIIIRCGKKASDAGIFQYLEGVFEGDIKRIQDYSNVKWPKEIQEEVLALYGAGAALVRKAEERTEERLIKKMATKMIRTNKSHREIAEFLEIPLNEVEKIAAELNNN